jgi:lysophospholipase L1-like esterase
MLFVLQHAVIEKLLEMPKRLRLFFLIAAISCLSFVVFHKKKTTVWLVGDSTMSQKEVKVFPETGWGMPFVAFFDSSVIIENRAKNGRSTRTFIDEGLWTPVIANLQPGDYVFIQFGHNDESKTKPERYTSPTEFKTNLEKYVNESRSKKAIPVLLTPVARRRFDANGSVVQSHPGYSEVVKEVASQLEVPLIDLDKKAMDLYQSFGKENSKLLFNHLEAGVHPNYPDGKVDDTHFNELGARKIAEIVLAEIKNLELELAERVVKPVVKK